MSTQLQQHIMPLQPAATPYQMPTEVPDSPC